VRPACARLANAVVGVLGPEFRLGSAHYGAAKSLTTDLGQAGVLAVGDPQALAALCGGGLAAQCYRQGENSVGVRVEIRVGVTVRVRIELG